MRRAALLALLALLPGCTSAGEKERRARLAAGRAVFTEQSLPRCTLCHTLRDAGATAKIGPDLDRLRPDSARVARAVSHGVGVMPAQRGNLSDEQIGAVAAYVAATTNPTK